LDSASFWRYIKGYSYYYVSTFYREEHEGIYASNREDIPI
jgi:hypothetical protein